MAAPKCTICQQALKSEEPKLKCRGSCGKHCHFRCVTKISVAYVLFCVHNTCVYICESCTKRENATGTAAFGDSSASALPKVTGKPSHYDNAEPSAASLLRQSDVVAKEASMLKSAYDPKLVEPHDKNAVQEHRTEDTVWNRGPTKNSEGESPSPEEKPHCMLCKKAVKLSNWDKHKQHCESTLVLCDVCHGYFPRRCIEEHTTTCRKQDAYSSVSTPSPQRPPSEEVTAITVQHISSNKVQRGSSEDKMDIDTNFVNYMAMHGVLKSARQEAKAKGETSTKELQRNLEEEVHRITEQMERLDREHEEELLRYHEMNTKMDNMLRTVPDHDLLYTDHPRAQDRRRHFGDILFKSVLTLLDDNSSREQKPCQKKIPTYQTPYDGLSSSTHNNGAPIDHPSV